MIQQSAVLHLAAEEERGYCWTAIIDSRGRSIRNVHQINQSH